jgi:hypothetical protein
MDFYPGEGELFFAAYEEVYAAIIPEFGRLVSVSMLEDVGKTEPSQFFSSQLVSFSPFSRSPLFIAKANRISPTPEPLYIFTMERAPDCNSSCSLCYDFHLNPLIANTLGQNKCLLCNDGEYLTTSETIFEQIGTCSASCDSNLDLVPFQDNFTCVSKHSKNFYGCSAVDNDGHCISCAGNKELEAATNICWNQCLWNVS